MNDDDYAIVTKDETHNQFPAIYVLKEQPDGTYKWEFDVVLGRPFILGDKLDILYVLDNEVHSTLLKDIEVIADFDTTEKRWELAQSEAAWKLVTELHGGFWNMIKHNRDRFKAIVAMDRNDGSVKMYLTCFTDRHEFVIPFPEEGSEALAVIEEDIENPVPIKDTLKWTNTVQNGAFLTAMDDTQYVEYIFDWDSFTLTILKQQPLEQEADEPAVSPWATVVGEYTMLKNGEVIGPLEGVTDPTGYLWTANRESFMIGSAGDGTQMFCYNIDDDTYFIFDVPAGPKANYHFATDLNERYFMFWITSTTAVWGDRKTQEVKQIRWNAQGYSGLSEPGQFTRPSISVDGKYYLHTSTNNSTPMFTTFSFETGSIVTEAPDNGTSQSAIGLNDAQRVMSNTPTGQINLYNINDQGNLQRYYYNTPEGDKSYVVVPTGIGNQLLFVKVNDRNPSTGPVWFVFDPDKITDIGDNHNTPDDGVISKSAHTDVWCEQTNPQGKGCAYRIQTNVGPCYLLTFATLEDQGLLLQYDPATQEWSEHDMPFGGLGNDSHSYNQPAILDGSIIITKDKDGNPVAYNVETHEEVDMEDLPGGSGGVGDADNNLVQIDDTHFAWCTSDGIYLYRVRNNGERTLVIHIPEHQAIVSGFNGESH